MATILVIDDELIMRELLRLHLSHAGYHTLTAEDAVEAGHMVVKQRPDLIVMDVEMPFMSGIEFLRALKADPVVAAIPVILLTSRLELEDQGKELGAAAFLVKPILADQLLATVAKYVDGGRVPL